LLLIDFVDRIIYVLLTMIFFFVRRMVRTINIFIRCCVEECYSPLQATPNLEIKRRVCSRAFGTVVRAVEHHTYEVKFEYDIKMRSVPSNSLMIVPPVLVYP